MTLTDKDVNVIDGLLTKNNVLQTNKFKKLLEQNNKILKYSFATKEDLNNLRDEIKNELTSFKSYIMNFISSFAKEIKDNREERTASSAVTIRNTRRIEKLETKVFGKISQ